MSFADGPVMPYPTQAVRVLGSKLEHGLVGGLLFNTAQTLPTSLKLMQTEPATHQYLESAQ